jgi:flagellar motor switch protein FliN/FliY
MGQEEIERLLSQANHLASPGATTAPSSSAPDPAATAPENQEAPPPAQEDAEHPMQAATKTAAPATTMPGAISAAVPQEASPRALSGDGNLAPGDIEFLLNQAEQALESINAASSGDLPRGVTSYRLEEFSGSVASSNAATLDLIRDVELDLKIELGRTNMYLEDVLKLRKGAVVPLDKLAGDPVDVYVNGRLIARGEVLVLNDNFCVRVAELIAGVNAGS